MVSISFFISLFAFWILVVLFGLMGVCLFCKGFPYILMRLEFLTQHEVELASAVALGAIDIVKAICPVDTHQTNHWKE